MRILVLLLLLSPYALADYNKPDKKLTINSNNKNTIDKSIDISQEQSQQLNQSIGMFAQGGSNEGVSTNINTENNASNVVLVPNNNTESCMRVYGIAFGSDGTSGGLGIPYRSSACDYDQNADDAAATGNHRLAWYWRCHKKNSYKPFRKGRSKDEAIKACYDQMLGFIGSEESLKDHCSETATRSLRACVKK